MTGFTPAGNPIFVVGVWRSGTSLLVSLLNQHPDIALMYECAVWDFPRPLQRLRFKGDWLRRQEFFNRALSRHRLVFGDSLRGLEQVATPEDLYKTYAEGKHATLWGEKAPTYARRLRLLAERFPQSSILLIWRDPAEVMRSVRQAGRVDSFFRRRGMLARELGNLEQMLADTAELRRRGHRLHEVDYSALVDAPAETLRGICEFLGVAFHPEMTSLKDANHVGLFESPIHNHLRNGVIARRQTNPELPAELAAKLARFRNRAQRLRGRPPVEGPEPSLAELWRLRLAHRACVTWDSTVRAVFEFVPFPWLRTYRLVKRMLTIPQPAPVRFARGELTSHALTIALCYGLLLVNAWLKFTKPNHLFMPLSLLPCAALTVMLNRKWGLCAAGFAAVSVPLAQAMADRDYDTGPIFVWNFLMRFLIGALFVVLADAARAGAARAEAE